MTKLTKEQRIEVLKECVDLLEAFRVNYKEQNVADFLLCHAIGFLDSLCILEEGGANAEFEERHARKGMKIDEMLGLRDDEC